MHARVLLVHAMLNPQVFARLQVARLMSLSYAEPVLVTVIVIDDDWKVSECRNDSMNEGTWELNSRTSPPTHQYNADKVFVPERWAAVRVVCWFVGLFN